jgi:hypothetical protein
MTLGQLLAEHGIDPGDLLDVVVGYETTELQDTDGTSTTYVTISGSVNYGRERTTSVTINLRDEPDEAA